MPISISSHEEQANGCVSLQPVKGSCGTEPEICNQVATCDTKIRGIVFGRWVLCRHTLSPSQHYMRLLCDAYADLGVNDHLIELKGKGGNIFVHRSRCGKIINVEEDDIKDLLIVRKFLYGQCIELCDLDIQALISLAICAHRHSLFDLFLAVLHYIETFEMLVSAEVLLEAKILITLSKTTISFKKYFCARISASIEELVLFMETHELNYSHLSIFLTLYEANLLSHLFYKLSYAAKRKHQAYLVHVIMCVLEPKIRDDQIIISLLLQLGWNDHDSCEYAAVEKIKSWSTRALQLCAIAMRSPVARGFTLTIPVLVRFNHICHTGRMIVRSKRFAIGSTIFFVSCEREFVSISKECWNNAKNYQGMSLYLHMDKETYSSDHEHKRLSISSTSSVIEDESDLLESFSKVRVWARIVNDKCCCSEGGTGVLKDVVSEFDVDAFGVGGGRNGWDCLLEGKEVGEWIEKHQSTCAVSVIVYVELVA